ncbi:MAG: type II toxin-antitoxin system VapC family toxin [Verrucomicrobiales bacterium]|nr:type II toxin-antitoxin system VapC family toxin [Verrucomicrobiales bacterium]
MKILLDTCTVSDYLRGLEPVVRRIQKSKPSDLAISAVTVLELRYGAARRQSAKLTAAVDGFLNGITILPFDSDAAEQAGVLRAAMEAKGHGIALADCQIAGTAQACGLTLVTHDGDLKRVPGLKVVDWRSVR